MYSCQPHRVRQTHVQLSATQYKADIQLSVTHSKADTRTAVSHTVQGRHTAVNHTQQGRHTYSCQPHRVRCRKAMLGVRGGATAAGHTTAKPHSKHRFPAPSSTLPELVTPLKGNSSLSPGSCPPTLSAPSERSGY